MTQDELTTAVQSGAAQVETTDPSAHTADSAAPAKNAEQTSTDQFVPMLVSLQSMQREIASAPTFVPQSFQDQIQFVFDGKNNWLYFYANKQWNGVLVDVGNYGDGSDGIVTIATDTTLTRDMFYTQLTVAPGVTFFPNGYKIFSQKPIIVNGTISVKGGNGGRGADGGAAATAGAFGIGGVGGTAGVGITTGSIKQPGNGIVGGTGVAGRSPVPINGNNGVNDTNCLQANNAANGGASGTGAINPAGGFSNNGGVGGLGGTATQTTKPSALPIVLVMRNAAGDLGCNPTPGSGAGGGGGLGVTPGNDADGGGGGGGGSGAPGGTAWICAPAITVSSSGTITAKGGDGGRGGDGGITSGNMTNFSGGGGGGGASGNGGLILLITPSYTNNGTVTVAPGTPGQGGLFGTGSNSGNAPANGSAGLTGHAGQVVQVIP